MRGISILQFVILAIFVMFGSDVRAEEPTRYILSKSEQAKFKGTFGINFSHYDFDRDSRNPICQDQANYNTAACSCTIDWKTIVKSGLKYAYSKASDGDDPDLSFARNWSELRPLHANGTLLRGAYHFLRPDVDAQKQAESFLRQIGAVNGKKPAQLPPVLDIEWSYKPVAEGSPEFAACPRNRLQKRPNGTFRCDMWHLVPAEQIVASAKKWIEIVEAATGRSVIIYTNTGGWWDEVMGEAGRPLTKRQAIWLSAYPKSGAPDYDSRWSERNGSEKWRMPPLPIGASYQQDSYKVAHFWQFTESGYLPDNIYTCGGRSESKTMELNWIPVAGSQFKKVFGVSGGARVAER